MRVIDLVTQLREKRIGERINNVHAGERPPRERTKPGCLVMGSESKGGAALDPLHREIKVELGLDVARLYPVIGCIVACNGYVSE